MWSFDPFTTMSANKPTTKELAERLKVTASLADTTDDALDAIHLELLLEVARAAEDSINLEPKDFDFATREQMLQWSKAGNDLSRALTNLKQAIPELWHQNKEQH